MFGSAVLNRRIRSTVILTLKSGAAFQGVLFEADRTAYVLRNASLLEPTTNPDASVTPVDGELVVLAADVAYMQVP